MNRDLPDETLKYDLIDDAYLKIIDGLMEGIMITDKGGIILYANSAAYDILNLPGQGVRGKTFASLFFENPENDAFTQTVLDAVYAREKLSESVVPFVVGEHKKFLRVYVSFFPETDLLREGLILVFSDLSELMELRDKAQDMAHISRLNDQLKIRNDLLQKTFGMFLSDDVVRDFLEQPGGPALGGKKKNLTIMMSDLRGFTALSEKMDADDLISMLNHYLGVMTDVIQNRGGIIIEFIGDGIMALFGAREESETHATEAVCAAIEMQAAMTRVNQWNARRDYPRLEMGIGLNTGEVIIGNVGSKKRMKYGVVGNEVNLCGRIESYTIGGQILISPSVRDAIKSPLIIEKEMTVSPKGAAQDIVLTHVTGIGEPYHVRIRVRNTRPKKLKNPLPVYFYQILGKHTEDQAYYGGFTAIGHDTAVLQTQAELKLYDNIQVMAGGRLLCKVIDEMEEAYLIQFTSIPSGFNAWVKANGAL